MTGKVNNRLHSEDRYDHQWCLDLLLNKNVWSLFASYRLGAAFLRQSGHNPYNFFHLFRTCSQCNTLDH